jgi:hypothetical protein
LRREETRSYGKKEESLTEPQLQRLPGGSSVAY